MMSIRYSPKFCSLVIVNLKTPNHKYIAKPYSLVSSAQDLNRRWLVRSSAQQIFFLRIDGSHCDSFHSSFTAVHCFNHGYVGKQPLAWKEYCTEYWLKEYQECMVMCTCHCNITKILLKTVLIIMQSINQ